MTSLGTWWRSIIRLFVWTTDMCDGSGDPSMAKGIAAFLGGVVGYDMITKGVGAANCAAAAIVISAAFGRSVFLHWLDRNTWTATANLNASADAAGTIDALTRARKAALPNMKTDNESGDSP